MYPWHHIHATVDDREAAALWHVQQTKAKRNKPSPRSENLYYGPNLLQFQTEAVAKQAKKASIDSIGLSTQNLPAMVSAWSAADGTILFQGEGASNVLDPWGVAFELVEADESAQSHLNISTDDPESLLSWYISNLGGERCECPWNTNRSGLKFDTITIFFQESKFRQHEQPWGPIDHIGWLTDDLDESYELLTASNTKFIVQPREFGQVRLAFIVDPCGILIELVEPPEGMNLKPGL